MSIARRNDAASSSSRSILENQRYALYNDLCKRDPAYPSQRWHCLEKIQTRTSWFWHLYYAITEELPPVPLSKG